MYNSSERCDGMKIYDSKRCNGTKIYNNKRRVWQNKTLQAISAYDGKDIWLEVTTLVQQSQSWPIHNWMDQQGRTSVPMQGEKTRMQGEKTRIPMQLIGGAFTIYQQLNEEKKGNFNAIKEAFFTAFTMDSFVAYIQFVEHWRHPEEIVDVF